MSEEESWEVGKEKIVITDKQGKKQTFFFKDLKKEDFQELFERMVNQGVKWYRAIRNN